MTPEMIQQLFDYFNEMMTKIKELIDVIKSLFDKSSEGGEVEETTV